MEQIVLDNFLTGRTVAGLKETLRLASEGALEMVILAADADECVRNRVCTEVKGIKIVSTPSKEELGRFLGLQVACAVCGVFGRRD